MVIQNQPFDHALEMKYIALFQDKRESFLKYEMLIVFQNIANGKEGMVERWTQKYSDVKLSDWGFDELRNWIDEVEDVGIRARLLDVLGVFEGHGVNG